MRLKPEDALKGIILRVMSLCVCLSVCLYVCLCICYWWWWWCILWL